MKAKNCIAWKCSRASADGKRLCNAMAYTKHFGTVQKVKSFHTHNHLPPLEK